MKKWEVIQNRQRREIIFAISERPKTITELEKELKINRGTLKHHISVLEENKMIVRDVKRTHPGKPTYIKLTRTVWGKFAVDSEKILKDSQDELKRILKEKK